MEETQVPRLTHEEAAGSARYLRLAQRLALPSLPSVRVHVVACGGVGEQRLAVQPPLPRVRSLLMRQFASLVARVTSVPRLSAHAQAASPAYPGTYTGTTYTGTTYTGPVPEDSTFQCVLRQADATLLADCYAVIEAQMRGATAYALQWLSYQALWDLDTAAAVRHLGDDLALWRALLGDMKRSRMALSGSAAADDEDDEEANARRQFGQIAVCFGAVQRDVRDKYDSVHRDFLSRFGERLAREVASLLKEIDGGKTALEDRKSSFAYGTLADVVDSVRRLAALEKQASEWRARLEVDASAELLLRRERSYAFADDWIAVERVQGLFAAFAQIVARRRVQFEAQSEALRRRVADEDAELARRTDALLAQWQKDRPVAGDTDLVTIQSVLCEFGAKMEAQLGVVERLDEARVALGMPRDDTRRQRLEDMRDEVGALREVAKALQQVWTQVQSHSDTLFADCDPVQVRRHLDSAVDALKRMPNRIRQYAAYDGMLQRVQQLHDMHGVLVDLSAGVLRPKHQLQLLKVGRLDQLASSWSRLTVGHLWQQRQHLLRPETRSAIAGILNQAQGESALEGFLSTLSEEWHELQFELVRYQSKCWLARNFAALSEFVAEQLQELSNMKQSPYFKPFREQCHTWENKLNRAQAILDLQVDVQRRWLYLEGVFRNSADVQRQLGAQFRQFERFDREFVALMRAVHADATVDVWVAEEQRLLARLEADTAALDAIQKALAKYLETQRAQFPRFYFVGDEDLLEIIGNARDPQNVVRHMAKMFAGIAALVFRADTASDQPTDQPTDQADDQADDRADSVIVGMQSREGERVLLREPVDVRQHKSVQGWLRALEHQMRLTLASLLEEAVRTSPYSQGRISQGPTGQGQVDQGQVDQQEDSADVLTWVERFPSQVVLLASQVAYSAQVERCLTAMSQSAMSSRDSETRDSETHEDSEDRPSALQQVLATTEQTLLLLSQRVLEQSLAAEVRKKLEQLITELVYQRDVTRRLLRQRVRSPDDFAWLRQMRFYWTPDASRPLLQRLQIRVSRARFFYGFEYLGVAERLVQTPLSDRAYLTLCEALHARFGANPFGPAGTGKTETVKALGAQLGRFVLVFNCDEAFDLQAMGRIFTGLCQVGAWGCFDEFNRLHEQILSSVSQQILAIQTGLRQRRQHSEDGQLEKQQEPQRITLLNKQVLLHPDVGLFVTMNPGYAGRSELPDNLKSLFRPLAMIKPDKRMIAQVMMFSQGFETAESLAHKVVLLFELCRDQLSAQSHYDFGLRALKSMLRSAGALKRQFHASADCDPETDRFAALRGRSASLAEVERFMLLRALQSTVTPKLVASDVVLFESLLATVFPERPDTSLDLRQFEPVLREYCERRDLVFGAAWFDKLMQLYVIQSITHGVMCVGPAGSGKSTAWRALLHAMDALDGGSTETYVLDPKAISKDELYGVLDPTTLEWTDGIFTRTLRDVLANVRGEADRRHWIVFDGDVDPEWAENLNSVLDDNKLLTLPNGERLQLTPNIRIVFETHSLEHATPATVSRCGMVWFNGGDVVTRDMLLEHRLRRLGSTPVRTANVLAGVSAGATGTSNSTGTGTGTSGAAGSGKTTGEYLHVNRVFANAVRPLLATAEAPLRRLLDWVAASQQAAAHVMRFQHTRAVDSLFTLLHGGIEHVLDHAACAETDLSLSPLTDDQVAKYAARFAVQAAMWAFGGSMSLKQRHVMSDHVARELGDELGDLLPRGLSADAGAKACDAAAAVGDNDSDVEDAESTNELPLLDWRVDVRTQEWQSWQSQVPAAGELEAADVTRSDLVIETVDTVRHAATLRPWLLRQRPLILCGPPGSGKSMTLASLLRGSQDAFELVTLNFSSSTDCALLHQILDSQCEVVRQGSEYVMQPKQQGKWLVLFCDEINLPAADAYGTQAVIALLRQLLDHGGMYKKVGAQLQFVRLRRVQIVGACNPPTDAGRVPLHERFLRHCPLVFVDFPSRAALTQIYGTLSKAVLRLVPALRQAVWRPLTGAMVDVYLASQRRFTPDQHAHYIYSPRELSRWVRALHEALRNTNASSDFGASNFGASDFAAGGTGTDALGLDGVVRLWAHEALRLFQDRLVSPAERQWMSDCIDRVARRRFLLSGLLAADGNGEERLKHVLRRPMLYTDWLTQSYDSVELEEARAHIIQRLKVFREEEIDVKLVVFDDVVHHILRIDRVLRQPLGHMLLVGASGAGKTVLSRFVAWMNNMSAFQIKVHRGYTAADFDHDLRQLLLRAGCQDERICFIFDESNVLDTAFLERMNSLLASGEVPGLFDADADAAALMQQCRDSARAEGVVGADTLSEEALLRRFLRRVQRNLHVVFTMNPSDSDFDNRAATSPALFNRCVVDWFGEWSQRALQQVGDEFTAHLDLGNMVDTSAEATGADTGDSDGDEVRQRVVQMLVHVHESVRRLSARQRKRTGLGTYVTPRHFLDMIRHLDVLVAQQHSRLLEHERHLQAGLRQLRDTEQDVAQRRVQLGHKRLELDDKNREANAKLEQMMVDQRAASKHKDESEALKADITQRSAEIARRRDEVERDLSQVEPMLQAAKSAVQSIRKENLSELTAMSNPPVLVKLTLEAVTILLGRSAGPASWTDIRRMIRQRDFVSSILGFQSDQITPSARATVQNEYLNAPQWDLAKINRASRACGPLAQWVQSQLQYATVLSQVDPMRREMDQLQQELDKLGSQHAQLEHEIGDLESRIAQYKEEYKHLVTACERIRVETQEVATKVQRSVDLVDKLGDERRRWTAQTGDLARSLRTLPGDALLSSGMLTYAGYLDVHARARLQRQWRSHLLDLEIPFDEQVWSSHSAQDDSSPDSSRDDNSPDAEETAGLSAGIAAYLSSPAEQLQWKAQHGLPDDALCVENAVMLVRHHRYPLMIDPSGQATAFVASWFGRDGRRVLRTSFLDPGFLRSVESAIRFGAALIVEDVEHMDPVLNSVLNRELTKVGGRVLVRLGDKDIDFSPSFVIFLVTRDPNAHFAPDLCSRVTLVNFSVTAASLQAQCLARVLQAERPDVERRRRQLLQVQSECRVRLRTLEEQLLGTLGGGERDGAAQRRSLLDDDSLSAQLQQLKQEARQTEEHMRRASAVMLALRRVSRQYAPFARACADAFFAVRGMQQVHFLYHFSLSAFLQGVDAVLHRHARPTAAASGAEVSTDAMREDQDYEEYEAFDGVGGEETSQRVRLLALQLLKEVFARTSRSLLQQHHLVLALRFAQVLVSVVFDSDSDTGTHMDSTDTAAMDSAGSAAMDSAGTGSVMPQREVDLFTKGKVSPGALPRHESDEALAPLLQALSDERQRRVLRELVRHCGDDLAPLDSEVWSHWLPLLQSPSAADDTASLLQLCHRTLRHGTGATTSVRTTSVRTSAAMRTAAANVRRSWLSLLLLRAVLPVRAAAAARAFVDAVFTGVQAMDTADTESVPLDLMSASEETPLASVVKTAAPSTPFMFVATPGNDPSPNVLDMAHGHHLIEVALGAPEAFAEADEAVQKGARRGAWVLLKNVHLAPEWLAQLEKRLHRLSHDMGKSGAAGSLHGDFRLFLTAEIHPRLPTTLLRMAQLVVFETPMGLQASLRQIYQSTIPVESLTGPPEALAQRQRIYLLLAWLHAVVQERRRYAPFGWSKDVDFARTDLLCALQCADEWVARVAGSRQHVDPDTLPWQALATSLEQFVYGGRLDNSFDQERLRSFARALLSPRAFDADFSPGAATAGERHDLRTVLGDQEDQERPGDQAEQEEVQVPALPRDCSRQGALAWIDSLSPSVTTSPRVLGLAPGVSLVLLGRRVAALAKHWLLLLAAAEGGDDDDVEDSTEGADEEADMALRQHAQLRHDVEAWSAVLEPLRAIRLLRADEAPPKETAKKDGAVLVRRTAEAVKNPLFRALARDAVIAEQSRAVMARDAADVLAWLRGETRPTNRTREVVAALRRDVPPADWTKDWHAPKTLGVAEFVRDFARRHEQLARLFKSDFCAVRPSSASAPSLPARPCVWLGGLFLPAAFVAACRQYVARRNRWPLEQVHARVDFLCDEDEAADSDADSFVFEGMSVSATRVENGVLHLCDETRSRLPRARFTFVLGKPADDDSKQHDASEADDVRVQVPVYSVDTLDELLFAVHVRADAQVRRDAWCRRGVAIALWSAA
ncbi:MAG: hypothetical protein MHM6MM_003872 [Cercozoa sp. M6MM]